MLYFVRIGDPTFSKQKFLREVRSLFGRVLLSGNGTAQNKSEQWFVVDTLHLPAEIRACLAKYGICDDVEIDSMLTMKEVHAMVRQLPLFG